MTVTFVVVVVAVWVGANVLILLAAVARYRHERRIAQRVKEDQWTSLRLPADDFRGVRAAKRRRGDS